MKRSGVAGTLATDVPYDDFANGEATHNMSYSEVGTIDIVATLDTGNYLGSGGPVTGTAYDVGRFVPDHFGVNLSAFTERPAFAPTSATFTYLGEEFGVSFTLTARNEQGNATQNYFGDFARIRTTTNPVSFYAIDDVTGAPDVNYTLFGANTTLCNGVDNTSQRLCQSASNGFDFTSDWMGGVRVYSGRLIFSRQASQAAEGPYNDLLIGIAVSDSDAVTDAINAAPNKIELDDSNDDVTDTEYNLLKSHVFRFGRIRLQNAYGSEIPEVDDMGDPTGEDLELRLVAEYWDGTEFIVHEDDVATSYASTGLGFVAGSYTDNLGAGEAIITSGLSGIIYQGESLGANVTDAPLFLQAPGVGNEGSALIDIDLDALGLRFLKYDWRSDGELEDIISGGANAGVDNPRALIEFGRFRGNDRIINWQEIFE